MTSRRHGAPKRQRGQTGANAPSRRESRSAPLPLRVMNENALPDWLLKAAQEANDIAQQMAPMIEAAERANDMVRPNSPIVRAAQQYADEVRAVWAAVEPLLAGHELALAMEAGMRELLAAVHPRSAFVRGPITVTGGATLGPMAVVGAAEVSVAVDAATVTVLDDASTEVGGPLDAKTVFLAILWVMMVLLALGPLLGLPAETVEIIEGLITNVGVGLVIHWRVTDNRKR